MESLEKEKKNIFVLDYHLKHDATDLKLNHISSPKKGCTAQTEETMTGKKISFNVQNGQDIFESIELNEIQPKHIYDLIMKKKLSLPGKDKRKKLLQDKEQQTPSCRQSLSFYQLYLLLLKYPIRDKIAELSSKVKNKNKHFVSSEIAPEMPLLRSLEVVQKAFESQCHDQGDNDKLCEYFNKESLQEDLQAVLRIILPINTNKFFEEKLKEIRKDPSLIKEISNGEQPIIDLDLADANSSVYDNKICDTLSKHVKSSKIIESYGYFYEISQNKIPGYFYFNLYYRDINGNIRLIEVNRVGIGKKKQQNGMHDATVEKFINYPCTKKSRSQFLKIYKGETCQTISGTTRKKYDKRPLHFPSDEEDFNLKYYKKGDFSIQFNDEVIAKGIEQEDRITDFLWTPDDTLNLEPNKIQLSKGTNFLLRLDDDTETGYIPYIREKKRPGQLEIDLDKNFALPKMDEKTKIVKKVEIDKKNSDIGVYYYENGKSVSFKDIIKSNTRLNAELVDIETIPTKNNILMKEEIYDPEAQLKLKLLDVMKEYNKDKDNNVFILGKMSNSNQLQYTIPEATEEEKEFTGKKIDLIFNNEKFLHGVELNEIYPEHIMSIIVNWNITMGSKGERSKNIQEKCSTRGNFFYRVYLLLIKYQIRDYIYVLEKYKDINKNLELKRLLEQFKEVQAAFKTSTKKNTLHRTHFNSQEKISTLQTVLKMILPVNTQAMVDQELNNLRTRPDLIQNMTDGPIISMDKNNIKERIKFTKNKKFDIISKKIGFFTVVTKDKTDTNHKSAYISIYYRDIEGKIMLVESNHVTILDDKKKILNENYHDAILEKHINYRLETDVDPQFVKLYEGDKCKTVGKISRSSEMVTGSTNNRVHFHVERDGADRYKLSFNYYKDENFAIFSNQDSMETPIRKDRTLLPFLRNINKNVDVYDLTGEEVKLMWKEGNKKIQQVKPLNFFSKGEIPINFDDNFCILECKENKDDEFEVNFLKKDGTIKKTKTYEKRRTDSIINIDKETFNEIKKDYQDVLSEFKLNEDLKGVEDVFREYIKGEQKKQEENKKNKNKNNKQNNSKEDIKSDSEEMIQSREQIGEIKKKLKEETIDEYEYNKAIEEITRKMNNRNNKNTSKQKNYEDEKANEIIYRKTFDTNNKQNNIGSNQNFNNTNRNSGNSIRWNFSSRQNNNINSVNNNMNRRQNNIVGNNFGSDFNLNKNERNNFNTEMNSNNKFKQQNIIGNNQNFNNTNRNSGNDIRWNINNNVGGNNSSKIIQNSNIPQTINNNFSRDINLNKLKEENKKLLTKEEREKIADQLFDYENEEENKNKIHNNEQNSNVILNSVKNEIEQDNKSIMIGGGEITHKEDETNNNINEEKKKKEIQNDYENEEKPAIVNSDMNDNEEKNKEEIKEAKKKEIKEKEEKNNHFNDSFDDDDLNIEDEGVHNKPIDAKEYKSFIPDNLNGFKNIRKNNNKNVQYNSEISTNTEITKNITKNDINKQWNRKTLLEEVSKQSNTGQISLRKDPDISIFNNNIQREVNNNQTLILEREEQTGKCTCGSGFLSWFGL